MRGRASDRADPHNSARKPGGVCLALSGAGLTVGVGWQHVTRTWGGLVPGHSHSRCHDPPETLAYLLPSELSFGGRLPEPRHPAQSPPRAASAIKGVDPPGHPRQHSHWQDPGLPRPERRLPDGVATPDGCPQCHSREGERAVGGHSQPPRGPSCYMGLPLHHSQCPDQSVGSWDTDAATSPASLAWNAVGSLRSFPGHWAPLP